MSFELRKDCRGDKEMCTLVFPSRREHVVTLRTRLAPLTQQFLCALVGESKVTMLSQFEFGGPPYGDDAQAGWQAVR